MAAIDESVRRYLHRNTCAIETALACRPTGIVPVAEVIAAGEPVMLSRFVPGDLISAILPTLGSPEAGELGHATGAVLAALAAVSCPRPGAVHILRKRLRPGLSTASRAAWCGCSPGRGRVRDAWR